MLNHHACRLDIEPENVHKNIIQERQATLAHHHSSSRAEMLSDKIERLPLGLVGLWIELGGHLLAVTPLLAD